MSNGMIIASELSHNESEMESYQLPRSLQTCLSSYSPVQPESTEELRMWLQQESLAHHFPLPESDLAPTIPEICGPPPSNVYAWLDPDSLSLKMSLVSLIPDISEPSSMTWPKAGMTHDGVVLVPPSWERRISEIGYGLLPTPKANKVGGYSSPGWRPTLEQAVKMWPTPTTVTATGGASLTKWGGSGARKKLRQMVTPQELNGALNPDWVELLMGWPRGWTSLEPLERAEYDRWLSQNRGWPIDWEEGTERVATGVQNRVSRLKAIGNGQVSIVAATAWRLLTADLEVTA